MNNIYQNNEITINNENTLILGADVITKKDIKKRLKREYAIIDNSFIFKADTVGEIIENINLKININNEIKSKNIDDLTYDEYYYLAIILKINDNPNCLVVDNIFGYLNNNQKNNIIKISQKNKINLIVFDNELYYAYTSFKVIVVHNKKVAIQGIFEDVVKEEKILKRLGYELPFYVDLSMQLMLYDMIGNICYSLEELVNSLWK